MSKSKSPRNKPRRRPSDKPPASTGPRQKSAASAKEREQPPASTEPHLRFGSLGGVIAACGVGISLVAGVVSLADKGVFGVALLIASIKGALLAVRLRQVPKGRAIRSDPWALTFGIICVGAVVAGVVGIAVTSATGGAGRGASRGSAASTVRQATCSPDAELPDVPLKGGNVTPPQLARQPRRGSLCIKPGGSVRFFGGTVRAAIYTITSDLKLSDLDLTISTPSGAGRPAYGLFGGCRWFDIAGGFIGTYLQLVPHTRTLFIFRINITSVSNIGVRLFAERQVYVRHTSRTKGLGCGQVT